MVEMGENECVSRERGGSRSIWRGRVLLGGNPDW